MKDDRCLQYALTVALNYGKIKNHPERIINVEPFIDQYNWARINFPSQKKNEMSLKKLINQLLLIFCMFLIIVNRCENHDCCKLEMPEKGKNILEYIPGEKSVMTPFAIYADLESTLEKVSSFVIASLVKQRINLIIIEVKIV